MRPQQLTLDVSLQEDQIFDNFYVGESVQRGLIVESLKLQLEPLSDFMCFLWGAPRSGRTHLMRASCAMFQTRGFRAVFWDAEKLAKGPVLDVDQLACGDLVCIDNIDALLGDLEWETVLFALYNWLRDTGSRLIVASKTSPRELDCKLADLKSRLSWGGVFRLPSFSEQEMVEAMQFRAAKRGFDLSDEVAQYILHREHRDTGSLLKTLDALDTASLEEQRRVTVPFVKRIMNW